MYVFFTGSLYKIVSGTIPFCSRVLRWFYSLTVDLTRPSHKVTGAAFACIYFRGYNSTLCELALKHAEVVRPTKAD